MVLDYRQSPIHPGRRGFRQGHLHRLLPQSAHRHTNPLFCTHGPQHKKQMVSRRFLGWRTESRPGAWGRYSERWPILARGCGHEVQCVHDQFREESVPEGAFNTGGSARGESAHSRGKRTQRSARARLRVFRLPIEPGHSTRRFTNRCAEH